MKQLYNDLWQTALEKPFSDLNTHAYLLQHPEGNILLYNTGLEGELGAIDALGGIDLQCLSHRHEDGASLNTLQNRFGHVLCADTLEAPYITHGAIAHKLTARSELRPGFTALPTPGHTDGGFSFYYPSPTGKTYLFTGDTLFQWNGRWSTLVLANEGGNQERLMESLRLLREIKPDVVLCSASVGDTSYVEVNEEDWQNAIDANLRRLRRQLEKKP